MVKHLVFYFLVSDLIRYGNIFQTKVFKLEGRGAIQSIASRHLSQFTKASFLKDGMYCPPALYPHVYVILCNPKNFHRKITCMQQIVHCCIREKRRFCFSETHKILSCCSGCILLPCPNTCIKIQFH